MIKTGAVVAVPPQTWDADAHKLSTEPESYRSRFAPTHVVISQGIPGYTGHRPHNPSWHCQLRRADLSGPNMAPYLQGAGVKTENYHPQQPHAPDHTALDRSRLPKRMPTPGYTGHMPKTREHNYGTSHWRPDVPPTRAQRANLSKASAMKKAAGMPKEFLALSSQRDSQRDSQRGYDGLVNISGARLNDLEC
jgi:hypothetical protein